MFVLFSSKCNFSPSPIFDLNNMSRFSKWSRRPWNCWKYPVMQKTVAIDIVCPINEFLDFILFNEKTNVAEVFTVNMKKKIYSIHISSVGETHTVQPSVLCLRNLFSLRSMWWIEGRDKTQSWHHWILQTPSYMTIFLFVSKIRNRCWFSPFAFVLFHFQTLDPIVQCKASLFLEITLLLFSMLWN